MRVIGIILVLLSFPVLVACLRAYPQYRKWTYFAVGILPFTMPALNLDAALVSWPGWTGYALGIIISLLDTLALAIIFTAKDQKNRLPFAGLFISYILSCSLSIFFSTLWMSTAFYIFQIIRVFIVFFAVATFAGAYDKLRWLLWGLSGGAVYQLIAVLNQKLAGVVQASGTMGHQNLLGLMLHFVTLPLLAVILAGEKSRLIYAGALSAILVVTLGASRGSLAFVALGIGIVICLSLVRGGTSHKWKVIGLGVLAAALVVPLALDTLSKRFGGGEIYAGPDGEREAFERAALAMWSDNPMGVGANQYVVVANAQGYSERAGVVWNWGSRSAKVHNMYLLAAAETGWLGLTTLIALIFVPSIAGIYFSLFKIRGFRGDIILGCAIAIIVIALHGLYEWVFFMVYGQYMFAIALGIMAGNLREARRPKLRFARHLGQVDLVKRANEGVPT